MVYVYLLKSKKDNSYYSGITKDLIGRLRKHNKGEVSYSRNHRPYEIVWVDEANNYKEARRIEKWLKKRSMKEKRKLCRGFAKGESVLWGKLSLSPVRGMK